MVASYISIGISFHRDHSIYVLNLSHRLCACTVNIHIAKRVFLKHPTSYMIRCNLLNNLLIISNQPKHAKILG